MDVLLSWSGQAGLEVAQFLREWLPEVLPGCKPWVSKEDIAKGKRWSDELHGVLDVAKATVVCVTPENVRSPWLYYESGYVASRLGETAVCPYLVGVAGKLVAGTPLGLYQWTEDDKTDALKLVRSLHDLLGSPHDAGMLDGNFQAKWPQLKRRLDKATAGFQAVEDPVTATEKPLTQRLSDEAKRLLSTACGEGPQKGWVERFESFEGVQIQANGELMNQPDDQRSVATWDGAIAELVRFDLMRRQGSACQATRAGWDLSDQVGGEAGS